MSGGKEVTLPRPAEMLERLVGVSDKPARVKRLYPDILHGTGHAITAIGVANLLYRAVGHYLDSLSSSCVRGEAVLEFIQPYLVALVEDDEARREVLAHLKRLCRN